MESLQRRGWCRKLCCFYKDFKDQPPKYLFNIIPKLTRPYFTRNANNITHFKVTHSFLKSTFFAPVIIDWNKLDPEIQNPPSLNIFKKNILKFIRPTANNKFCCHNLKGIKYLTRWRLGPNYFHEHKFKNNFQHTLNPLCACDYDVENTCHFLLHCLHFLSEGNALLSKMLILIVIFGNSKYFNEVNLQILKASIDFILTFKRFDEPLLNS